MMKLGTVVPYLKKSQKIYKSPDTPQEKLTSAIFHWKSATFLYEEIQMLIAF